MAAAARHVSYVTISLCKIFRTFLHRLSADIASLESYGETCVIQAVLAYATKFSCYHPQGYVEQEGMTYHCSESHDMYTPLYGYT